MRKIILYGLALIVLVMVCPAMMSLIVAQQGGTARYFYDDNGRLRSVILPTGKVIIYQYDASGNLTSILHQLTSVSIAGFTPESGPVGTTVTINGAGFSPTSSENVVLFNGVPASILSAAPTALVVSVPVGATSGLITVSMPTGTATSTNSFTVTVSTDPPTISSFTPSIGAPGTAVTITGTNFDATPASNNVKFNVATTQATSATSTSLTATVPTGATSGRITVSTASGSATSTGDFFAPPPPFTAADVAFTSRMTLGSSQVVTINTVNKIGLIVFDALAGQRFFYRATARNGIFGYALAIFNPNGSTLVTRHMRLGDFIDTTTLPFTGTYTILIDPETIDVGSCTFSLASVPPDPTASIVPGGPSVTIATTVQGQDARLNFTGTAGQKISFTMQVIQGSFSDRCGQITILAPDSSTVLTQGFCDFVFLDAITLPVSGNYTILIRPGNFNHGPQTMLCTLYNVPPDLTGTITIDGPSVELIFPIPGQNARLFFNGTAGQRVSIATGVPTTLLQPDSTIIASVDTGVINAAVLPVTGIYTIFIDPQDPTPFLGLLINVYSVPPDVITTIIAGGPPVTVTTVTLGHRAILTFEGTEGQPVSLTATISSGGFIGRADLLDPDGNILGTIFVDNALGLIDTLLLPVTGTYKIVLVAEAPVEGSTTFTLYNVPADFTGGVTIDGDAADVTISTPGQNADLTFSGTAGQRVFFQVPDGSEIQSFTVSVLASDGTFIGGVGEMFPIERRSIALLPATGTYHVIINPVGAGTGHFRVILTSQ